MEVVELKKCLEKKYTRSNYIIVSNPCTDVEIILELNANQDVLPEYVANLCVLAYNSRMASNIRRFEKFSMRTNISNQIRDRIRADLTNIVSERNVNRLQWRAAHPGQILEGQPCYICNGICSNPQIEHVMRILLLEILTSHLPSNHPIHILSTQRSHAWCNIDLKGTTALFNILVDNYYVRLETKAHNMGATYENELAPKTRDPRLRQSTHPPDNYIHPSTRKSEVVFHTSTEIDANIALVTDPFVLAFNQANVSVKNVIDNLNDIVARCVPTVEEIFANVQQDAVRDALVKKRKYKMGSGIRKNKPTKTKKNKNNKTRRNNKPYKTKPKSQSQSQNQRNQLKTKKQKRI